MLNVDYIRLDAGELPLQPNGFLQLPANITRTGVFTYYDRKEDGSIKEVRQLRMPEEVFSEDSLASLIGLPATIDHPHELVSPGNARKYVVGMTSDQPKKVSIKADDAYEEYIQQTVTFFSNDAIDLIKSKKKTEMSLGYVCDLEDSKGVWKGQPYDSIQRNIRYNHLSLVDSARGGSNCRVLLDDQKFICDGLDLIDENKIKEQTAMKQIVYKGSSFQVDDASFVVFNSIQKDNEDLQKSLEEQTKENDQLSAKLDESLDKVKSLEESVKTDSLDKKVEARVALEVQARKVLGDSESFRGKSDRDIKVSVIKKLRPAISLDGKSDDYISVRFDCCMEDAPAVAARPRLEREFGQNISNVDGMTLDDSERFLEETRAKAIEKSRNLWKSSVREAK